jgi:4-aminobutyrate aminotransferase
MDRPRLHTALPGPAARELVERDQQSLSPSYTRDYPLVAESGQGAWITDADGNRFLDLTAGIAVCATGHCHPAVVAAIQEQAARLIHMSGTDFYYRPEIELAERLVRLTCLAGDNPKVFFTNSGTESVEGAIKLARYSTGRPYVIAFFGAFHGRTLGALAMTASKPIQRRGFSPLLPGSFHAPYAYCYRCPVNRSYPDCQVECARFIENVLFQTVVSPDEVAAILVEPIQGEGGYVVPPPEFHRELRAIADRHGILLIADEIQSGVGRTGRMFAMEHWDVKPDIVVLAKGLASGMPLGAILAGSSVMRWPPGSHGTTFGGNPVACAAGAATLELVETGLMTNAAEVGSHMMERLREMQRRHPLIGDVRGLGLMIGIELVRDRNTKQKAPAERKLVIRKCFEKGLLLLGCGANVIRICPALVLTHDEAEVALDLLDEVLSEVEAAR